LGVVANDTELVFAQANGVGLQQRDQQGRTNRLDGRNLANNFTPGCLRLSLTKVASCCLAHRFQQIQLIPSNFVFPPVDHCPGTSPSHAENSRPL
jgi:hypothetical protein